MWNYFPNAVKRFSTSWKKDRSPLLNCPRKLGNFCFELTCASTSILIAWLSALSRRYAKDATLLSASAVESGFVMVFCVWSFVRVW